MVKQSIRKQNEVYIRSLPCLVTGRPGSDCAHWPTRRSHGGDYNLLNLIPLSREWHRRADDYQEPYRSMVDALALHFHKRILESQEFSADRLGEPYWTEEDGLHEPECSGVRSA